MTCGTCKDVEIILFADDTNIEETGCSINNLASDLKYITDLFTGNMLVLNLDKIIQLNLKTDNLDPRFDLNNQYVKIDKVNIMLYVWNKNYFLKLTFPIL